MDSAAIDLAFYVDGIRCLGCVSNIEKTLKNLESVDQAHVHFDSKVLNVKMKNPKQFPQVEKSIRRLGFRLAPADSNAIKTLSTLSSRKSLKQLALAGSCAGNIMMFAVPIYAGLEGTLKTAFEWISFFLFLPVLTYSAQPFFKGALASLRTKTLSIDLPITLALILTSSLSFTNLVRGNGLIYFDSTASFVFLILVTRYFNEKARLEKLAPVVLGEFLTQKFVLRKVNDGWAQTSVTKVQPGDRLRLLRNEILAFDAINENENAAFDTSFVNGESIPKNFARGALLTSGFRALEEDVQVTVERPFLNSRLALFVEKLNRTLLSEASSVRRSDQLANILIAIVCSTATLVFLSGYWLGWSEMLSRATALLVIACPCALAFAAPLTLGAFLKKALRKKIFIRDPEVFEDILECRNVILDKTGTLTKGQLNLYETQPQLVPESVKQVVLAMEQDSEHPVAFAFRKAWKDVVSLPVVDQRQEQLGLGVAAQVNGSQFELRTANDRNNDRYLWIELTENHKPILRVQFRDSLREDTLACVNELRAHGKNVSILSGDSLERTMDIAQGLQIPTERVIGNADPEKKSTIVGSLQPAIMVGDGVNDALALAQAKVGIAVRGHFEGVLSSARVFIPRQGLSGVIDLLNMSEQCQSTLKRNLTLALTYNVVGAALAITGHVNPMGAAIAMPVSSTLILLSTLWGIR